MPKLAIVGASGKLGFATLTSLLNRQLISPSDIVCTTSSHSGAAKLEAARKQGVVIRSANFDSEASLQSALQGCDKVLLISSARIEKDYNDAAPGQGREADHFSAIEAARNAGVKHVYYTSLAFANPSRSRVMKAHERTEEFLRQSGLTYTIIREGLYNESWPLYLGYYDVPGDDRSEITVGGDGSISWTSIADLGLGTALILAAPSEKWAGKAFYLSQSKTHTLQAVAAMVAKAKGEDVKAKIVPRAEHEKCYIQDRGMDAPAVQWWAKTYDALREAECAIDDPTLEALLKSQGVEPESMETTVGKMLRSS